MPAARQLSTLGRPGSSSLQLLQGVMQPVGTAAFVDDDRDAERYAAAYA